tara:strand:+ start:442 stop:939 length:498 start_codon:yes stop_codon:yes gene_type:complete
MKTDINNFKYNDGGRELAGYKGKAGDCVTRAIAIATGKPYQEVYDDLAQWAKDYSLTRNDRVAKRIRRKGTSPRNGVNKQVYRAYLQSLGWEWVTCNEIGQSKKVHLDASELPKGRIICKCSRHLTTMIDGVINDTYNPQRKHRGWPNERMVYGYYRKSKDSYSF